MNDLYTITKFVRAKNAKEALEKEKTTKVSEIYVNPDWLKQKTEKLIDKVFYKSK